MRLLTTTLFVSALNLLQVAAQGVTVKAPGTSFAAGTITVTVADSGTAPTLSQLASGTIDIIYGGNADGTFVSLQRQTVAGMAKEVAEKEVEYMMDCG